MSLYLPDAFREADPTRLFELIEAHGFATLISYGAGAATSQPVAEPVVSHLPLLLERDGNGAARLLGHVARANPHWRRFDGDAPALAIFQGPHAYVSPAWYATHPSVPTWNYAVVHVHGAPVVVDEAETWRILQRLVEAHEGERRDRWVPDLPPDFLARDLRAIVGFHLPIARLEAKFKLGQNRSAADLAGAIEGLEREPAEGSRALAELMRRPRAGRGGG